MTKEELDEKYVILESRENILDLEAKELEKELEALIKSKEVSELTAEDLKREVEIRRRLSEINDEYDNIKAEYDSLDKEAYNLENEEKSEKRSSKRRIFASLAFITLAGALGFAIGRGLAEKVDVRVYKKVDARVDELIDKKLSAYNIATAVPTEGNEIVIVTPTPEVTPMPVEEDAVAVVSTPTPTPVPTPTPFAFSDPTNDEEVEQLAEIIIDEDVNPMLEDRDDEVLFNSFEKEDIEDIIRMANGQLPKNTEYDENTVKEVKNLMNHIFANQGTGNTLYPMYYSKFYPEGSREAEYVKTYDDIYNKIAQYRAEGNVDGFVEEVGYLGTKLYNEWHIAGLYGGYDPYLFPQEEQYFLLQAAISRFPNYVMEYMIANDLTICSDTCYDPETMTYKLVEVRDIFEAITSGISSNGVIVVIRDNTIIIIIDETREKMESFLDSKAKEKTKVLR